MKLEDIFKPLELARDSASAWIAAVAHPFGVCTSILDKSSNSSDALLQAFKIWFVGALITILVQSSIFRIYHIDPFRVDFFLSVGAVLLSALLMMAVSVHCGFLMFKLPTRFQDIFITFLVFASFLFPLIGLSSLPVLMLILEFLNTIKLEVLDFSSLDHLLEQIGAIFVQNFESKKVQWNIWLYLSFLTSSIPGFLFAFLISMVLNYLSKRAGIERTRIFDAGTFGLTIGAFLSFPVAIMYLSVLYSFIER
ncbi:hypothetical protein [Nitrosospira briensis]|uniref:hypothetical protein n=1 Tax=Nitrosospira briensis TaxID=35799 RepID=UPI000943D1CD|nr:hypothetical protein [Nitrosospira briensis]